MPEVQLYPKKYDPEASKWYDRWRDWQVRFVWTNVLDGRRTLRRRYFTPWGARLSAWAMCNVGLGTADEAYFTRVQKPWMG